MAKADPIATVDSIARAYQHAEYFKVPKIITAHLTKTQIDAISCGVEIGIASIVQVLKQDTEGTDPTTLANAILCTALEAYLIGELS